MSAVVIENPVLNSPFDEPRRHFGFDDQGITSDIIEGRRRSSYFVPVPASKRSSGQLALAAEWTQDRLEENDFVNRVRERVVRWRNGGYVGVTRTTRRLLDYWQSPDRERKFFFCQIEAAETAIYLAESAVGTGDQWIENELRKHADEWNDGLYRIAFKMATGSGKTVLMAMLIAWQSLNKRAAPRDTRFTDAFLVVTPGITIRDRLRVLLPSDPGNYYAERDIVPPDLVERLGQAKIHIVNFHKFLPRKTSDAGRLHRAIIETGGAPLGVGHVETEAQVVRRLRRDLGLGTKRQIIVFNDEAHHCYRGRPAAKKERLTSDERREAKERSKQAHIWLSGLQWVQRELGIKVVYDLSATPFFLRGSGYDEGTLFPWVVSDFSLIDAIESGIVKVPRVPVSDDAGTSDQPVYRNLWIQIRDELPKHGRKTDAVAGEPRLPPALEAALRQLYDNYARAHARWQRDAAAREHGSPPVFIIVCNNTNVSKLVYDFVGGWEQQRADGGAPYVRDGALTLFSNATDGRRNARPNTILIDSAELESGDQMSAAFKRIARTEIDEFKRDYRHRYPGRDSADIADEDLLREVMNTVGKPGRLGERVKCVVSVSMLTEGWDANSVTHVLGVRAFGTQLLCEQVVGRALRRRSYEPNADGLFDPEYAEVYGVPFSFIPASGTATGVVEGPQPTRVRALPDRAQAEIVFPNLTGYRYDIEPQPLTARFDEASRLTISTQDVPTETTVASILGEDDVHTQEHLQKQREQTIAFHLARRVLERQFRDDDGNRQLWAFPSLLRIAGQWLRECVELKDNVYPQLLLVGELGNRAAERIFDSIEGARQGAEWIKPIVNHYNPRASSRFVDLQTTRPVMVTNAAKCHVSHVVADTGSWEQKAAETLETMPEVLRYVKNHGCEFRIPYTHDGAERWYYPDFVAHIDDGHGAGDLLNLVLEVSGRDLPEKQAKTAAARAHWTPAVNNHGGWGRWAFFEARDPWNMRTELRAWLAERNGRGQTGRPQAAAGG